MIFTLNGKQYDAVEKYGYGTKIKASDAMYQAWVQSGSELPAQQWVATPLGEYQFCQAVYKVILRPLDGDTSTLALDIDNADVTEIAAINKHFVSLTGGEAEATEHQQEVEKKPKRKSGKAN